MQAPTLIDRRRHPWVGAAAGGASTDDRLKFVAAMFGGVK